MPTSQAPWAWYPATRPKSQLQIIDDTIGHEIADGLTGAPLTTRLRANSLNVDMTEFDKALKGDLAELRTDYVMRRAGYEKQPSKLHGKRDNGIDGFWIRYAQDGSIDDVLLIESKFDIRGRFRLRPTKDGPQMSQQWIRAKIREMQASSDPGLSTAGDLLNLLLRQEPQKVRLRGALLTPDHILRFLDIP